MGIIILLCIISFIVISLAGVMADKYLSNICKYIGPIISIALAGAIIIGVIYGIQYYN